MTNKLNDDLPMLRSSLHLEPYDEEKVMMYLEPTIAWRCWAIHVNEKRGHIRLQSITHKLRWPPEVPFRAFCLTKYKPPDKHDAPDRTHKCGIYAVKTQEAAQQWIGNSARVKMMALGQVKLWGKIHKYERGYLAEYAYPESILVEHEFPENFPVTAKEAVHELRRTYRGVKINLL